MIHWLKEHAWAHVDFAAPPGVRRKSGVALLIGFALIGGILAWRSGLGVESRGARIAWGLGVGLGLGVMAPAIGRWIYLALMLTTGLIGMIVNFILLGAIFFLVFSAVGVAMRLMGKDLLDRRGFRAGVGGSVWRGHSAPPPRSQYRHLS